MTKLTFAPPPDMRVDIPIEVRRPNLALVGRTVASGSLDVEPGLYFVTAAFPGGEHLTRQVDVTSAQDSIVVDLPLERDGQDWPERFTSDRTMTWSFQRAADFLAGNALRGSVRAVERRYSIDRTGTVTIDGRDEPQFVRFLDRYSDRWFSLPAWGDSICKIDVVSHEPDIVISLEHHQANLLLELRANGQVSDEQTALGSVSLTSERLLRDKRRDPVAAVVSAYTLLRFNELERLHDWTKNMFRWFETLPDAAVLYGEHLGRLGDHEEALAALLALESRGLPLFSEGIRLAIDRLTLYERYGGKTFSEDRRRAAAQLADKLEAFAAVTDFNRQTTTFRGPIAVRADNA